jgi:4-carboxymuconolactone decarboxylase
MYIYSAISHFIPGRPKDFCAHSRNALLKETVMRIAPYSPIVMIALLMLTTASPSFRAAGADPNQVPQDRAMPTDIDPQSGFRLPLPKREELDEAGRAAFDRAVTPGRTIAGLQGPAGVQLYSPKIAPHVSAINQYLRYEAGYSPHVREVAILTTAREMDSQFEWVAHEPEALKVGVPQAVIDAIKYRRDTAGLDAADAAVIELGRALWRDHKVSPDLFARAKALFGPHMLIDLVLLMGNYAGTAALLSAVDMQLHAGKQPLLPIP